MAEENKKDESQNLLPEADIAQNSLIPPSTIYNQIITSDNSTAESFYKRYEEFLDKGLVDEAQKLAETHIKLKEFQEDLKSREFERWTKYQEIENQKLARLENRNIEQRRLDIEEAKNKDAHRLAVINANNDSKYKRDELVLKSRSENRLWAFTIFCLCLGILLLISGFPVEGGILITGSLTIHGGNTITKNLKNGGK